MSSPRSTPTSVSPTKEEPLGCTRCVASLAGEPGIDVEPTPTVDGLDARMSPGPPPGGIDESICACGFVSRSPTDAVPAGCWGEPPGSAMVFSSGCANGSLTTTLLMRGIAGAPPTLPVRSAIASGSVAGGASDSSWSGGAVEVDPKLGSE